MRVYLALVCWQDRPEAGLAQPMARPLRSYQLVSGLFFVWFLRWRYCLALHVALG
jgi:hypothetical protein